MATRRSRHHDPNPNRPMFHPRNFKYSAANDSIEPDQKTFENSGIPYLPANDMRDYPVEQSKPVEIHPNDYIYPEDDWNVIPTDENIMPPKEKPEETLPMKTIAKTSVLHAYTKNDRDIPPGYVEDKDSSNPNVSVLVNHETKHVITAFRGTVPTDVHDLWSDVLIAAGSFGFDYTHGTVDWGNKTFSDVKQKYTGYDHLIAGHSLGGHTASAVSKKYNVDSMTFNEGFGLGSLPQSLSYQIDKVFHPERYTSHHISYTNILDPISFMGHFNVDSEKRWFYDSKDIHSLTQVLKY